MLSRITRSISPESRKAGAAAFAGAIAVAAIGLVAAAGPPGDGRPPRDGVEIQLLGVNDFHGHLESPGAIPRDPGGPEVALGGAGALDAHLDDAARSHPGRTIRVHAGDMVGASPLLSSNFHDEPSVRAMNLMEFDVGTLGNHEFDEGGEELIRLLRGGQRDDDAETTSASDFEGVNFPYIAANTVDRKGELQLPPTKIIERAGVRIGFIGVTTEGTPRFVLDRHTQRFRWLDISTVVNRHAARLRRRGVEAIVVLAHSGAFEATGDPDLARGEIIDETREMSDAVDVVIAGHSHSFLNLRVPNRDGAGDKLVVEAQSYGRAYDRVRMTIDRATGHVLDKSADTPRTWNDEITPDPAVAGLVARYREALGGLGERVVGRAAVPMVHIEPGEPGGNLGTVAARGQRRLAGADIAFVDGGNLRGTLDAGPITYAELFSVNAYEHPVMRMRMSGRDVLSVLAQRATGVPLHVDGPDRIDPQRTYTVAANRLLIDKGGIGQLTAAAEGAEAVGTDLEALVAEVERAGALP